jgi:glycosyltransferase involved in cell wall biosynthesis
VTTSILHVSQPTTYGLARYVSDATRDQVARGWRVTVASPVDGPLAGAVRAHGAEHRAWEAVRAPDARTLGETRRLRRIVDEVSPDAVVLHSSKAGLAGRLAIRGRLATVFTPHAWSFLHGGLPTRVAARVWERRATRWTDTLLCVSESERRTGELAGVDARYAVVPNAVDLTRFSPIDDGQRRALRARLALTDAPLAVSVGRLAQQKGQDVLVSAWPAIARTVPDARLVIIGDGPMRAELSRAASDGVDLLGERDDVVDWLRAADVVVQPSRWEGLSYVALEAIACGRSVVGTDVAGMRDVVGDAGAIVPVGDVDALAREVAARLGSPIKAAAEGRTARARAARFDLAHWGDALAEVVTGVVDARAARSGS